MVDLTRQLVDSASQGDAAAVNQLLIQHLPKLQAFVRLRMGPQLRAKEGSADLVQSTCREVLEHIDRFQYRGEAGFKNWLYTTAMRKIVNRHEFYTAQKRDAGREVPLEVRTGSSSDVNLGDCYRTFATPSRAVSVKEALELTEKAFDQLPEHYREVIILARLVGMSRAEIAERTGRTEGAVRTLLSRALATLAEIVESSESDSSSG